MAKVSDADKALFLFAPAPPGGGVLVLSPALFRNKKFTDLAKQIYPHTKLLENKPMMKTGDK